MNTAAVKMSVSLSDYLLPFTLFPAFLVPLSAVKSMTIYDEGITTMRVRWKEAEGATGYMLLYSAINATQPTAEQEVGHIQGTLRTHCVSRRANSQAVDMTEFNEEKD